MSSKKSNEENKSTNRKVYDKKYDAKRAGRTRNYTAVLYPEDLPPDWRERINETHVKWVESPLHDKDLNADGQPKKAHHHGLFMWENVKSLDQVIQYFKDLFGGHEKSINGVALPQAVSDRSALVRYFAHLDNPEKVQYDIKDIIGHNGADVMELLSRSLSETLDMMVQIEEYIEQHNITKLCDLAVMIRYEHKDWYQVVTTKNTVYFNAFIRSRRHKMKALENVANNVVAVDDNTGEIITADGSPSS